MFNTSLTIQRLTLQIKAGYFEIVLNEDVRLDRLYWSL